MSSAVHKTDRPETETLPPGLPTTLRRPGEKPLRSFKPWMMGGDTIGTLLDRGWSLGICCRQCPRTIEMKPEAIEEEFGAYRRMKLVDLLPKLTCGTQRGCGSAEMVLFPWKVKTPKVKAAAEPPPIVELPF